jgi:uncharacterized Fe-S cluster protein YjdI
MRKAYDAPSIRVTYDPRKCIHAKRCVEGSPEVFHPGERPWIQPEKSDAESLARTVSACPTGALLYERLDGGAAETVPSGTTIALQKDGPIYVRGSVPVVDAAGNRWDDAGHRYALCRCGGSGNKPYCDNTHLTMGFEG